MTLHVPKRSLVRPGFLELKDADGVPMSPELKKLFEELQNGFNSYKSKQDRRHDDLQRRLDAALLDSKRPIVRGEHTPAPTIDKGWSDYLRKGFTTGLEEKALSVGSNPDGGYLVPEVLSNRIIEVGRDRSNIRAIASVVSITTSTYEVVADPNDLDAAWVSEAGARSETTTPQLAKIVIPAHEIYAMPKATQTLLDDSAVNIEEWLSQRVADKFTRVENQTFVNGDGVGKPRGFLSYPTVETDDWAWGSIGYIKTGQADFDAAPASADDLVDLIYALKTEYRQSAVWIMNSKTAARVRKFKDSNGDYIWQTSLISGQPAMLLGYPVVIAEDMDDVGDGNFPMAFGNFQRGYQIVDRVGVRILRDPYSAKPYVMFYTTKRVGGAVVDFDAIKLLKTAAS